MNLSTEDLGGESKNLKYFGTGKYNGREFHFEGHIKHLKIQYHMVSKFNKDFSYDANVFEQNPFVLDVQDSDLTVTGGELDAATRAELLDLFRKRV